MAEENKIKDVRLHRAPVKGWGYLSIAGAILLIGFMVTTLTILLIVMVTDGRKDFARDGAWIVSSQSPSGHCYDLYTVRGALWGQEVPCQ